MIRPVRREEYPAALKVIGDAFSLAVRPPTVHTTVGDHPDGHFLAAERDGAIVGTGASIGFGPTGWIGGIAVAPSARGARLGQALTEAVIEALGPRETLLLLASDAGRPIYERLGFEVEERYRVFWSPDAPRASAAARVAPAGDSAAPPAPPRAAGNSAAPPAPPRGALPAGLRQLTAADREAVAALDALVTGEARSLAVDCGLEGAIATPDLSAVAFRPPWPALPIVASDPEAGATLLRALISPGLRLAVPESNVAALATLRALGCTPGNDVVRMRRGAPLSWRPDELWGVFSLFFG